MSTRSTSSPPATSPPLKKDNTTGLGAIGLGLLVIVYAVFQGRAALAFTREPGVPAIVRSIDIESEKRAQLMVEYTLPDGRVKTQVAVMTMLEAHRHQPGAPTEVWIQARGTPGENAITSATFAGVKQELWMSYGALGTGGLLIVGFGLFSRWRVFQKQPKGLVG